MKICRFIVPNSLVWNNSCKFIFRIFNEVRKKNENKTKNPLFISNINFRKRKIRIFKKISLENMCLQGLNICYNRIDYFVPDWKILSKIPLVII